MTLKKYHQKRNFHLTPEPFGKISSKGSALLYLIQKHAASHLHYDLRLEMNGVLKSWAVPKGPSLDPELKRLAVEVEDHPISYGSFEGLIPKGQYGAGAVLLWDQGRWQPKDKNTNSAYKKGSLSFILEGKKLKGAWKLIRLKNDPKNWLLIKEADQYARKESDYLLLERNPKSVKSGLTIEKLEQSLSKKPKNTTKNKSKTSLKAKKQPLGKLAKMPTAASPELATAVAKPPLDDNWLHEIKFDGYRLLAFLNQKTIHLKTRNQNDWTIKFPHLVQALKKLKLTTAIMDGELVALDERRQSNFQLLQNAIHEEDTSKLIYYIFDLIYYNGRDLSQLPLYQRKELLKKLLAKKIKGLRFSEHIIGQGRALFKNACELALEGIISKFIQSPYEQKRSAQWLKVKCIKRQEFIVVGFTKPQGKREYFGSLLLAVYNKQHTLQFCGHVGTGFTGVSLKELYQQLKQYITKNAVLTSPQIQLKNITWVKPKITVEVEFTEWTKDGILRHPSFKGLRQDKAATEIKQEKVVSLQKVKAQTKGTTKVLYPFTHPAKILYPQLQLTKLDLAAYYEHIKAWILPYIKERPLTIVRCPEGQKKPCFYQKHLAENSIEGLYTVAIQEKNSKKLYLYLKDAQGLNALVQLATLEIHHWGSHIDRLEKPDILTFDLDPDPQVQWKEVIETAFFVKEQLEKLNLQSFVKTTGGKGLHVVLPLRRQYSWEKVEIFAHTFVNYLVSLQPKLLIATMSKAKRTQKIFLDYLRNQRGATVIAPYSTRAKPTAPIATPLAWEELSVTIRADSFTIQNIITRLDHLKQDPWEDFHTLKQSLRLPKT